MIIGEIRRYLRDNNSIRISRSMRDTAYKAMQIKERLTNQNQREPTVDEIAAVMELPKGRHRDGLGVHCRTGIVV